MSEPDLLETFLHTLSQSLERIKTGNFPTDPLIASFSDHSAICRTTPVSRDEL